MLALDLTLSCLDSCLSSLLERVRTYGEHRHMFAVLFPDEAELQVGGPPECKLWRHPRCRSPLTSES